MKVLGSVLLLLASVGTRGRFIDVRGNFGSDEVVRVFPHQLDIAAVELLSSKGDEFGRSGNSGVDFKVSASVASQLEDMGVDLEYTTSEWISRFENNFNDPNLFCEESPTKCASTSLPEFHSRYQDQDAILARISNFVADSDDANMFVIGTSYEGQEINVVEIGHEKQNPNKPVAFIFCTVHAREWLSPMFCTYFIEQLLTSINPHPLVKSFALSIIPIANPDGFRYSTTVDNAWRKTRMPNEGSSCVGTDPNRNWDNNHCQIGSSTDPCSGSYCGKSAFDQPEMKAIDTYGRKFLGKAVAMLDIHSQQPIPIQSKNQFILRTIYINVKGL